MPDDSERPPVAASRQASERWILGGAGLFVFGFLLLEVVSNFERQKLGALFMVLAWPPLLVLHEVGHAIMAKLVGFHICRIVIGFGRPVARFQVGNVPVELRLFPVSGYVLPAPTSLRGVRIKTSLVYAAGPGAEALLLVLLATLAGPSLTEPSTELPALLAQGTGAAIMVGLFFNLLPLPLERGGVTDGLGMLQSFLRPDAFYLRQMALPFRMTAERLRATGRAQDALHALQESVRKHPENPYLSLHLAAELLEQGLPAQAGQALEPLSQGAEASASLRTAVFVGLARAARHVGGAEALDAALHYLEQAGQLLPRDPSAALETAAVRLAQGQVHEARKILDNLDVGDLDGPLRLELDLRRAELEATRGHDDEARALLAEVRARGGAGRELSELEARLKPGGRSPLRASRRE